MIKYPIISKNSSNTSGKSHNRSFLISSSENTSKISFIETNHIQETPTLEIHTTHPLKPCVKYTMGSTFFPAFFVP